MTSSLYECHVMHARFSPRRHRFLYRIFLFALDLDEVESVARHNPLFSCGRRNIYSFRDADYLPIGEPLHAGPASHVKAVSDFQLSARPSLKERVVSYASEHGVDLTGGKVVLLTLPRVFGYLFNPVSFYFCYDRDGVPAAAIAEVTNTFREVKPYLIKPSPQDTASSDFRLRVPKHFYVSPYSDVDVAFDFTLRAPGSRLSIQIDDYVGGDRTLTSTLTGKRSSLTTRRLAWFTFKYPFVTLRVILLIHWHALRLWWKKVPWFAKSARRADQRALYRPHHSLQPSDAA